MSYLDEHAPMFPPFVVTKAPPVHIGGLDKQPICYRQDVLAWTSGHSENMTTGEGECLTLSGFADLQQALFSKRDDLEIVQAILLFTECKLQNFVLFNECLENTAGDHPECEIYKNGQDEAVMIKIKRPFSTTHGPRVAYIVSRQSWVTVSDLPPPDFLAMMAAIFEYCNVGSHGSPAALGMAILRQSWLAQFGATWKKHRHTRPPLGVLRALKDVEPVGLVETIASRNQTFDEAYEVDSKSAYLSQWRSLPTGTCIPFGRTRTYTHKELMTEYKYYIATRATCTITRNLPVGVFPQRVPMPNSSLESHVIQPRDIGVYTDISMSSELIAVCEQYDVKVEIQAGFAWKEITEDANYFVDLMQKLRDKAPNDWIRATMKVVGVAVVGAMGMDYKTGTLTTVDNPKTTRTVTLLHNGAEYDIGVIEKEESHKATMTHWHYKAIDGTRAMLTPQIMRYAMQGGLISVDTDGFLTSSTTATEDYPDKAQHKNSAKNGTMLVTKHTNVHNVGVRSYQSNEKDKLPGVAKVNRAAVGSPEWIEQQRKQFEKQEEAHPEHVWSKVKPERQRR